MTLENLDIIEFPDPVTSVISFLKEHIDDIQVSTELPVTYTNHVLINSVTSTDTAMTVRESRYVMECRAKGSTTQSADGASVALANRVAAVLSAWARAGSGPLRYSLISLVDSFPDIDSRARSVLTAALTWHAVS